MAEEEEDPEKEALRDEIRELSQRVAELESALTAATRPIGDLMDQLQHLGSLAGNYFRLLELYHQRGSISPEAVLSELKDPISVEIIKVLFEEDGLNVSEIAGRLRERRGSASRTIVRERLTKMLDAGMVVAEEGPGGVTVYGISESVRDRWLRLLGLRR